MKSAVALLTLAAGSILAGTFLFSPRVALLVLGVFLAVVGVSQIEVKK